MKKQIVVFAVFVTISSVSFLGCTKPEKENKEEKKRGCGCQSSENVLDLRGTTEKTSDGVTNPTAKL
jgi:hypothetical protein